MNESCCMGERVLRCFIKSIVLPAARTRVTRGNMKCGAIGAPFWRMRSYVGWSLWRVDVMKNSGWWEELRIP